jgi:hypothetical protein
MLWGFDKIKRPDFLDCVNQLLQHRPCRVKPINLTSNTQFSRNSNTGVLRLVSPT